MKWRREGRDAGELEEGLLLVPSEFQLCLDRLIVFASCGRCERAEEGERSSSEETIPRSSSLLPTSPDYLILSFPLGLLST